MKRGLLAIFIVLIAASVIVLTRCGTPEEIEESQSVFLFDQNLKMIYGDKVELLMFVPSENAEKVDLLYDGEVLNTWNTPKDTLKFEFSSTVKGVGTRNLSLRTTYKDGKTKSDERYLRVLSEIIPEQLTVEIVNEYPHNTSSFTQGLEFYDGKLFESTGLLGKSIVTEVDVVTGKQNPDRMYGLDGTHFGEGISIIDNVIYQLTWQNQKCITYDLGENIVPKGEFFYNGEGWGLCNNGEQLIMSDGTERLNFRDPSNFSVIRTIEVYNDLGPITALNELEFIDGKIFANIWQSNKIVVIDPDTGKVLQEIDGSPAVMSGKGMTGEVLNGIAYNRETKKIYLTGKLWEKLLEVRFVKISA